MPQIGYADLHCDTVTVCCDKGGDMRGFAGQINLRKLKNAGCIAQCFAIFTQGENAAENFERFSAFYNAFLHSNGDIIAVNSFSDVVSAEKAGKTAAILTVENLGFLEGDESKIARLKSAGVKMASLTWNHKNAFGCPCCVGGALTDKGRLAVGELNAQKIIIDISHLSDGGAEEVFSLSRSPVVASHSNCRTVCGAARNLTDGQIKKLADKGGVAGLNFCRAFIGSGEPFEGLYLHYRHMVEVGGEDLPAIGSDFDGIPTYEEIPDCTVIQKLFEYFERRKVKPRALEKLARKNFFRVFKEVCG